MAKISLSDINLLDVGNTYHLVGSVWSGGGKTFIALTPDSQIEEGVNADFLSMTIEEWQKFLKQSDTQETEILANDHGNIKKTIVRKTARVIEGHVQWRVFKRDGYRCRYCGRDGIKLTVDHVDLWEEGGPSVETNLLTACSQCNHERGSTKFEDWIASEVYKKKSRNINPLTQQANLDKVKELPQIRSLRFKKVQKR